MKRGRARGARNHVTKIARRGMHRGTSRSESANENENEDEKPNSNSTQPKRMRHCGGTSTGPRLQGPADTSPAGYARAPFSRLSAA